MAAVINLDNVKSRKVGHIYNLQYTADIENGGVAGVGALVAGERQTYVAVQPATAGLSTVPYYFIAGAEAFELYREDQIITDYVNLANIPFRAYELQIGDVVTISDTGFTGTSVEGQYLAPQNGSFKLAFSATLPTTKLILQIEKKTTISIGQTRIPATRARVIAV